MRTQLIIEDLQQAVHLGCSEEERAYPQIVSFHLALTLDASESMRSDRLSDTFDYVRAVSIIEELCSQSSFRLLERMCFAICQALFDVEKRITEIHVQATKRVTPLCSGICARLELCREDINHG